MKKNKRDYIAKLVIYGLPDMNPKELSRLYTWIESIDVTEDHKKYAKIYTAKLMK